jgi:hypothetical protein
MAAWLRYNRRYARNEERDATCRRFLEKEPGAFGERDAEKRRTAISSIWETLYCMKKIGFLSFGHWTPSPQSRT